MSSSKKKLLIIGAGAAGLPSIRHSLFYDNVETTCFEKTNDVGGLWNFKPYESELSSVMKSTVINTSKEMTAFSDFPPDDEMANYMHNTQMHQYLKNYARNYNLYDYIKFNHTVESIDRNENYEQNGKWNVKYIDDKGNKNEKIFDGVMICSGHHAIPHSPTWPGQDQFKGRIIHSHSYKEPKGYEDKITVVVGIGNSGADCAVELSRISKQVYLVTRRGSWIFYRLHDGGEPTDIVFNTKARMMLSSYLPMSYKNWQMERFLNKRLDHEKYGLKPNHPVSGAHSTMNDELGNRIASGTVRIKPGIKEFTQNGIIFDDGTHVDHVDEVILATGYSFNFKSVENGNLVQVEENRLDAYKYVFSFATSDHNTLGIIGLIQGDIVPISEMQARVFLESFVGNLKLPNKDQMLDDITLKRERMAQRFVTSRRHTIQVDSLSYMHELGDLIGASPNMFYLALKNPYLAYRVFFGPCVPYVFRLNGPNVWDKAEEAIYGVEDRVVYPTNPKLVKKKVESRKNV